MTAAEPEAPRHEAIWQAMLTPLVLLIPCSLIGVWVLAQVSLRPIIAFRTAIGARGRGNFSPVKAPALPEEIAPLAAAVNEFLSRLRRALEAERSFTASSLHELRTPIAAALAQTQRPIHELPQGAARGRAQAIETGLKRLAQLSAKLPDLATAEGAGLLSEPPQNLRRNLAQDLRLKVTQPGRLILSLMDGVVFNSCPQPDRKRADAWGFGPAGAGYPDARWHAQRGEWGGGG